MKITQFVTDSLGDASYIVISDGIAAVVDPQRDVRPFLAAAREHGAEIRYVFETHVHNDYVSGGRELAALGATIVAPASSGLEFPHVDANDGDEISVGCARLRAVAAPGHTYEHTAYLAIDEDGVTHGAFTGGSLLVGSAGRSDLLGPDHSEELTQLQWQSAHKIAALLMPESQILPTHGAGSFCSTTEVGGQRTSTLANEQIINPALASVDFAAFRAGHLAYAAPVPGYYRHMALINRSGARLYGEPPSPGRLTADALASLNRSKVHLIDVRGRFDFARGHVHESVLIDESTSMLAYFGWLVPFNAPLALIVNNANQAERVTVDLFRIGYEDVRGYTTFSEWLASGRDFDVVPTVGPGAIGDALRSGTTRVIDVRFAYEHAAQPLPGAQQRPIDRSHDWMPSLGTHPALVICQSGQRAAMAASFLAAEGHDVKPYIDGGVEDVFAFNEATPITTQKR
jgi:glyoxylase-like metal-dependent hydrolase (beta-lactamase superfamily II)/rhodanese-related sulfurtransferase